MTVLPAFTTGQVFTASAANNMANSGLTYVTSATAGTAVSSFAVSNCFSATYDDYRIVISGGSGSGSGNNALFQFDGITGSVYETAGPVVTYGAPASLAAYAPAAGTTWLPGYIGTNFTSIVMDVINPNVAKYKGMHASSAAQFNYLFNGQCSSTSLATGFTFAITSPNTMTGVKITVYGYRKA
jgi:hypothetical protein